MRKSDIVRTCGLLLGLAFLTGVATPQATVNCESLPVYSKMDATSDVVKTLKKGDAVVIEMSIQGEDNAQWCSIRQPNEKRSLGYVRCQYLARPPAPKAAVAPVQATPAQPATQTAGRQAAHDDFWDPYHQPTFGEMRYMGEAAVFAVTFGFSPEQKHRALQIADEAGIPACIEDDDKYVRKGVMPPNALSSAPLTECDWIYQTFYERVFALVTPEQQAAQRPSYDEFKRQVTGRRSSLERRVRGR